MHFSGYADHFRELLQEIQSCPQHSQHDRYRANRRRRRGRFLHSHRPRGSSLALGLGADANYLALVPRAMPRLAAGLAMLWLLLFFQPLTPAPNAYLGVACIYVNLARLWPAAYLRHALES